MSAHGAHGAQQGPAAPDDPRRRRSALLVVRFWLPAVAVIALAVAVALLVGLLTGAWAGEDKNIARWIGVVVFGGFAVFALWARARILRTLRDGGPHAGQHPGQHPGQHGGPHPGQHPDGPTRR